MGEIWESRVCDRRAVLHGCATRFVAWKLSADRRWQMVGTFWTRAEAEEVLA